MSTKEILLAVTGSIATYKACEILRLLQKQGHSVNVIMTEAATRFVSPLTFQTLSQHPVYTDMFAPTENWKPIHIALAEKCDLILIAPATANTIAKLAHGIADNLLTATILASTAPKYLAPAMNEKMYLSSTTQSNLTTLRTLSYHILTPTTGTLACGITGQGHLLSPSEIVQNLK